jgi:N-acetylneuraminic acid mutarotase
MLSSVSQTYSTNDSTIQNIQMVGGYDSVVGYDYDWTNAIDTSGAFVAAFLGTLAQCPKITSIDIEAHSEGVAVTLSALTDVPATTRQVIKHVIAVAGPIMGTPMANAADLLAYWADQPLVELASNDTSEGLGYVLSQPFVNDLMVSTPGDNSKLDIIRRTVSPYSNSNAPQIFAVAGDDPGGLQKLADIMASNGVNFSDGFIPLSSALAFQNNSSTFPVLKVYPLPPFPGNHTQLISNVSSVGPSVAHAVGAQINTSNASPTLSLSSIPTCANNTVCTGTDGTYFALGGSGLSNGDNYALYQQDDTGNVTSPSLASSFVAANGTVPPKTWYDTPPCGALPRTLVLFAQDTSSGSLLASNAATEQVVAGSCVTQSQGSISISPASVSVVEGGMRSFSATVSTGGGVNWSIQEGSAGGTITTAGEYTAPNTTGTFHVIATSATNSSITQAATVTVAAPPPDLNEWTWMAGSNIAYALPVFGTQGVAATTNDPGNRGNPTSWTDDNGNLWLFGGASTTGYQTTSYFNDLWRFNTATNLWTWVGGTNVPDALGVYGTQGVAAVANVPGARRLAASWVDANGNFWIFDGIGYGASGPATYLDDLWEFSPANNEWTSIAGPTLASYGTMGVPASSNHPEIRTGEFTWVDSKGKFWLFGGANQLHSSGDEFNDLWQYDPVAKEWTWMGGSNTQDAKGIYGTEGMASPSNYPGARADFASSVDADDNIWIFGGYGYDSAGNPGDLNDLWRLNTATMQWTWVSGSNVVNAVTVPGTKGVAAPANVPGSCNDAVSWNDSSDNFWLFSGNDGFNDLWEFNLTTKQWTWMGGFNSNPGNNPFGNLGVYGTKGVAAAANAPGSRSQGSALTDKNGVFWLFGGVGADSVGGGWLDDLWRYQP